MIIKIGDSIYDGGEQIMSIKFSRQDLLEIKGMPNGHNIYTSYPSGMEQKDIDEFVNPLRDYENSALYNENIKLKEENERLRNNKPKATSMKKVKGKDK